jgi:hypothetical protein
MVAAEQPIAATSEASAAFTPSLVMSTATTVDEAQQASA